jgi:hypothetical protein
MFSKEKIIIAYTMEKCKSCNLERTCEGVMQIEKIFGESIEQ